MHHFEFQYLELTEEINALDYLYQAKRFIEEVESDPIAWKWVILTLHSALYGFAICALTGTNSENVIERTKKGNSKLISFKEAIKRCQNEQYMTMTIMSKVLTLSASQQKSIKSLNEIYRNNLEHYIPKTWVISLHLLPEMILDILDIIRFLGIDSGNYTMLTNKQTQELKSFVFQSKRIIKNSTLFLEYKSLK